MLGSDRPAPLSPKPELQALLDESPNLRNPPSGSLLECHCIVPGTAITLSLDYNYATSNIQEGQQDQAKVTTAASLSTALLEDNPFPKHDPEPSLASCVLPFTEGWLGEIQAPEEVS